MCSSLGTGLTNQLRGRRVKSAASQRLLGPALSWARFLAGLWLRCGVDRPRRLPSGCRSPPVREPIPARGTRWHTPTPTVIARAQPLRLALGYTNTLGPSASILSVTIGTSDNPNYTFIARTTLPIIDAESSAGCTCTASIRLLIDIWATP